MTDPIADMLTQIRNAQRVNKSGVVLPLSKVKFRIAEILKNEGYVKEVKRIDKEKLLKITLKYSNDSRVIKEIKKISRSGQRIYVGYYDIPRVLGGLGIVIVSTSQGLMTGKDARKRKLGGELICRVY